MSRQLAHRRAKPNQERAYYPALNQLVTDQEQQVNEVMTARNQLAQLRIIEKPLHSYADEEEEMDVSMEELKQSDAEKMSVIVSQLLAKNKISAKNAFEVPLIHLHQTFAFAESSSDNSWKRLSSSLESNNKIYAYRVDATHSETYRILEIISRQEKKNSEEGRNAVGLKLEKSEELHSDSSEYDSSKKHPDFLEKNYRNINIVQLDTFFNVNPILEKTKRIFDQNGTKTLLLNCLDISRNLSLTITLLHQQDFDVLAEQQWQSIELGTIWMCPLEGENIFRQIQYICVSNNLLGEEDQAVKHQTGEIESMWTELDGFRSRKLGNAVSGGRSKKFENENGQIQAHQAPQIIVTGPQTELKDSMFAEGFPQNALLSAEGHNTDGQISQQQLDLPGQLLPMPITSELSQDFSLREGNTLVDQSQTSNIHLSDQRNPKLMYSHDIVLREITEGIKEEDLSLDAKKVDKPQPKRPRKKKQFVPLAIDFLQRESIALSHRMQNLSIDKNMRKEFKTLLKELKINAYVEKNVVIDLKSKLDFRMKTLLSCFRDKDADQGHQIGDESRIIDLDFFSTTKTKMMRNGRNISIHDTKQSLKKLIESTPSSQISFIDIYEQMVEGQGYISPALCFLTVLHLANENGYSLMQHEGEYNYIIIIH